MAHPSPPQNNQTSTIGIYPTMSVALMQVHWAQIKHNLLSETSAMGFGLCWE
jgi:hypothetical protein